jgi:hypothetical protein
MVLAVRRTFTGVLASRFAAVRPPNPAPTMTTRGRSPSTPARGTNFKRFYSNDCVEREAMRFYPLLPIVAGVAQNATAALNSAA